MTTPLDKHGYAMSESDGPNRRYRLILGFETLDDLQAAHEYVVRSKRPKGKLSPNAKTVLGSLMRKSRRRTKRRAVSASENRNASST